MRCLLDPQATKKVTIQHDGKTTLVKGIKTVQVEDAEQVWRTGGHCGHCGHWGALWAHLALTRSDRSTVGPNPNGDRSTVGSCKASRRAL